MVSATWLARPRPTRNLAHQAYIGVLFCAVAVNLGFLVPSLSGTVATGAPTLFLLAALAVAADVMLFAVDRETWPAQVHASVLPTFAILLEWARGTALVTQILAVVISGAVTRRTVAQVVFDVGRYGLALYAAARVLKSANLPYTLRPHNPTQFFLILAAAAAWFVAFHVLTTTERWLRTGERWIGVSVHTIGSEALWAVPLLLLAPLLVAVQRIDTILMVLVLAPMYAVSRSTLLLYQRARSKETDPLTRFCNRSGLNQRVTRWIATHPAGPEPAGPEPAARSAGFGPPGHHLGPPGHHLGPSGHHPRAPGWARASPERGGHHFALLTLDLNRFRYVNESLGHDVGDRVLCAVSERLTGVSGAGTVIARLGGDEFGIFAPGAPDVVSAARLSRAIEASLAVPILVDDLPLEVSPSIGIAIYPEHGRDFNALLRHAGRAMFTAKRRDEASVVYTPECDSAGAERLHLVGELRRALEDPADAGIQVRYQPQVDLRARTVSGVEALLRWRHPERGDIPPDEIIRAAEHTGVMGVLTRRVLDDAVAALVYWRDQGFRLRVSINISVRDLATGHLTGWLADRLRRDGIDPHQIQLEITESALMADPDRVLPHLNRLHEMGVDVSLDDFGTGYSSLVHLRRLPVTEVKIDRSFVRSAVSNPDDATIVRSIIGLARELGMRVVAEGVEDQRTARLLRRHGCDTGQGWYFAKDLSAIEVTKWLRSTPGGPVAFIA